MERTVGEALLTFEDVRNFMMILSRETTNNITVELSWIILREALSLVQAKRERKDGAKTGILVYNFLT